MMPKQSPSSRQYAKGDGLSWTWRRLNQPRRLRVFELILRPFQVDTAVRRRSVALNSDPAMREMVHFVGSHAHDSRLKAQAF